MAENKKRTREADEQTKAQLAALGYDGELQHERPLLICDVDEVVLHLVTPFVEVIRERGFTLKSESFKLTGNVFCAQTGREATQYEVWEGLTQLFEEQAQRQQLIEGAVEGLNELSEKIDVIFLTNMPHQFGDIRRRHLSENGLTFPLVTNTGSKVPAIEIMARNASNSIGFIDDTPRNLTDVYAGAPMVNLFHFMANDNFRELAGEIEGSHFSTGDWDLASREIHRVLVENNSGT